MWLPVKVYRNADPTFGDATIGGVSSKAHTVLLVGCTGPLTLEDNEKLRKYPILKVDRWSHGVRAVPEGDRQWCFGGNFLFCSDSRFAALNRGLPIPIHDRDEFKPRPQVHEPETAIFTLCDRQFQTYVFQGDDHTRKAKVERFLDYHGGFAVIGEDTRGIHVARVDQHGIHSRLK